MKNNRIYHINGKFIDASFKESQLKRLTIQELLQLCFYKKTGFKKVLINYLLNKNINNNKI